MSKNKSGMPKYMLVFFITILGGLASWSMYNLLNQGVSDLLAFYGIANVYLQNIIIIIAVIAIFFILGISGKKVMKILAG